MHVFRALQYFRLVLKGVFIQEGNNIVRERERVAKLYKEEKEVGAKAQDLERQAKELRTEEAKKKEERAGATELYYNRIGNS